MPVTEVFAAITVRDRDGTDWHQILALYDQLLAMTPTPVVALNRAIALGEVEGPGAALDILDGLDLGDYHLFHAARADLLRRVGRHDEATQAYARAAALAASDAERTFLTDRVESMRSTG
jgi:RNA polymerase sigma-70 factor, ECF subfamily